MWAYVYPTMHKVRMWIPSGNHPLILLSLRLSITRPDFFVPDSKCATILKLTMPCNNLSCSIKCRNKETTRSLHQTYTYIYSILCGATKFNCMLTFLTIHEIDQLGHYTHRGLCSLKRCYPTEQSLWQTYSHDHCGKISYLRYFLSSGNHPGIWLPDSRY